MQFQDVHSGYPLKGEGVKVTSCLVTSEELARRGQHINLRWPRWSSLTGHKWSTLSGHRGVLRRGSCLACQTRWVVSILIMSEDARSVRPHVAAMGWRCMNSN